MLRKDSDLEDKPILVNGDNLSLLSIASDLRRGSVLDDITTDQTSDKYLRMNDSNEKEFKEYKDLNIAETINNWKEFSLKKKSETLSVIANKYANGGQYLEAIRYYSKSISLYDEDYRLYCNRSFCYEKSLNFEDSLADALRSVILMPTKPKPYFRQGKALLGLKRYSDAEKAFNKVLEIDSNCDDTKKELLNTRYLALRDFGINVEDASTTAISSLTVGEAIEASRDKIAVNNTNGCDSRVNTNYLNFKNLENINNKNKYWFPTKPSIRFGTYKRSQSRPPTRVSSNMYFNTTINSSSASKTSSFMHKRSHSVDNVLRHKKNEQMFNKRFREYRLPKNLFGYKGLWIGNVSTNCKPIQLHSIFGKYGSVDYINVVGNSFCAFVNYHNPNSPRIAIANLYGQIIPGVSNGDRPLVFRFIPANDQKDLHYMRPYQPKGTNECYFWRTTGCKDYNCPLFHYPVCKGIDFQPWMNKRHKKFF